MRPSELFRYCPRCAAPRAAENCHESPLQCRACGLVFFFNPTVAAAAFISNPAGRVLFVRRAQEPSEGKLGIPGGFIDMGESAEEGVRREAREEVALEIDRLGFLASFPNDYAYRGVLYPVVDLYFTAIASDPESAQPLDGVAGIEWHDPLALVPSELAFPSLRAAVRTLSERTTRRE